MKKFVKVISIISMMIGVLFVNGCAVEETKAISETNKESSDYSLKIEQQPMLNTYGTSNVKLIKAYASGQSKYGITWCTREYLIRVKNINYQKTVQVHHKMGDGSWKDYNATFQAMADNGYELWVFSITTYNPEEFGNQFVIKYSVNGSTYWDNNNGLNYTMGVNDGVYLGNGVQILNQSSYISTYDNKISVTINVRNLAYTKDVKLIYTTNNWSTSTTVQASHLGSFSVGYSYQPSPNVFGIENWSAGGDIGSANTVQFYLKYTVNGVTYYDNNFGKNYVIYKN